MEDRNKHALIGAVTFLAAFGLLVGGAFVLGTLAPTIDPLDETDPPQYDTEALYVERIPAEGQVEVRRAPPSLIVIDDAHFNNYEAEEIRELTSALVRAGHEVRTVRTSDELVASLDEADALVVIEPTRSYDNETAEAVQEFVEDDGRLLLMGGPKHAEIDALFLVEQDHELDSVANRFGVSFGTDHVYDMEANDGNHRNVVLRGTDHPLMADVSTAVFSTGTHVSAADGEPLLVTNASAQRAGGSQGEFTMATASDDVMAVGDIAFMRGDRFNVADNNAFIAAIVEFLGG